jgi:ketosteroid isomerase-like protein
MMKAIAFLCAGMMLAGCAATPSAASRQEAREQVMATERAFAKTMADRDLNGFASFLAEDTVFFSGPKPLHGKQAVAEFWSRFYTNPKAPFSWGPEDVEVLESGSLALSAGPVHNPEGKLIGRFTSIWRLEAPGKWRIVFDKGGEVCDCPKGQP